MEGTAGARLPLVRVPGAMPRGSRTAEPRFASQFDRWGPSATPATYWAKFPPQGCASPLPVAGCLGYRPSIRQLPGYPMKQRKPYVSETDIAEKMRHAVDAGRQHQWEPLPVPVYIDQIHCLKCGHTMDRYWPDIERGCPGTGTT